MKVYKLNNMQGGWFIGNFEPSIIKTNDVEVAVKKYNKGAYEESHYHKIATEITVVVEGTIEMNGKVYLEGDIIMIEPYDKTDFRAITNVVTTVIKFPGANDDKYLSKKNDE
jgi:quercetin dioxygenase-like cupin family protein